MNLFKDTNTVVDEWTFPANTKRRSIGLFGPTGWCLVGLYWIWPQYVAIVVFNKGFGVFHDN